MALQGNCIHTTYVNSGETETFTYTTADGTEATESRPIMNAVTESFTDIYVVVDKVELVTHYHVDIDNTTHKIQQCFADYSGYTNKAARDLDKTDTLFDNSCLVENYDFDSNAYSQSYIEIKKQPGMENLVDV